ncbi:unnamed protein product [Brassica oleracea var. botrytis]|uniref:Reverse transcriptase zinc-binding domain-containing protein n=3 Tax=Brassica TaxID=3705 RepID=A0A0D2ZTD3_BRAOL|nr:unnamed protein product [Brassica napus]
MVQGCELCGEKGETRDHFFFACPYSDTVWESLARRLVENSINPDWQWTVHRLQKMSPSEVDTILVKLLLKTTVYHIWRERTARRHQQSRVSMDHMRRLIEKAGEGTRSDQLYHWLHIRIRYESSSRVGYWIQGGGYS